MRRNHVHVIKIRDRYEISSSKHSKFYSNLHVVYLYDGFTFKGLVPLLNIRNYFIRLVAFV